MPELAEVEYYRKQWDAGLGERVEAVRLHTEKRIFRGSDPTSLKRALTGAILERSEAHGKQLVFRFSKGIWLGLHMGLTGELREEPPKFRPGKHDHLVIYQQNRALVFSDMRQFGRVRFHIGTEAPEWWDGLPVSLSSREFTPALMRSFLTRHGRLPLKASLLLQSGFPGVGNWMADEILWRAGLDPRRASGGIREEELKKLWRNVRFVCREALKRIGRTNADLPSGWLFHERWSRDGRCPRHGERLMRETVGGRTTAWCRKCQRER